MITLGSFARPLIAYVLVLQFLMTPSIPRSHADEDRSGLSISEDVQSTQKGTEYISGSYPGAVLMPISLWGPVNRAGTHHIPTESNLIDLFSYAGGPLKEADMDGVTIRRKLKDGSFKVIELSLDDLVKHPEKTPVPKLEPYDVVLIDTNKDTISNNTLKTITFLSLAVGIILTSLLISDRFKPNNGLPY